MTESSKIHPAIIVNNIKNFIPNTLEMETGQYSFWSGLFKNHCRAYEVLDHIIPTTTDNSSSTTPPTPPPARIASWARLDAIVLQWIYGTISLDLLCTVYKDDSTAQQAWDRLKGVFHDNRNSCAVHLQHQFANIRIDNFPDSSAYCQELKIIADQLGNIGAAIEEDRLVLQLVTGLNDSYLSLKSIISHQEKLPSFYEARSMLILEESHKQQLATQAASNAATTLVSSTTPSNFPPAGRGRNQGTPSFNGGFSNIQQQWAYGPWAWSNANWAIPPCPFPTTPWTRPQLSNGQPGILGPRPSANYANSVVSQPTDLESAMHTMTLNPPDENWYLDIGATSHMTNNQGISEGDPNNVV
ncbi:uncharacterized protein [Rutidosis leptorrhynchoides]|uniref:uncharacterized protein n=1 Tax=Rutidosis leptorrhynchoides TaxID=125765 RepID=UPI003A9A2228